MNPLSAMRGTRMGRVVKTPEEVMEELARSHGSQDMTIENVVGGNAVTDQAAPKTSRLGDLFSYESLELLESYDFALKGLETEEGRWEKIVLSGNPIVSQADYSYGEWVGLSNGSGRLVNGKYEKFDTGTHPDFRLAPMKAVYWFMRAGYEAQSKIANGIALGKTVPDAHVITSLQLFLEVDQDSPAWLFADHFLNQKNGVFHHYLGWIGQHFYKKNTIIPKTWTDEGYFLSDRQPINEFLATLLGDTDPLRVEEVFQWANGISSGLAHILRMPCSGKDQKTTAIYEVGPGNLITISANCELSTTGPAHMIKIDDKDFTPRGGA